MELTLKDLKENRQEWLDHGYRLPSFDADKLKENTLDHPVWVHFGAGNIFKAFHAAAAQRLIEAGVMDTGIVAAEGFDGEIVSASMRPHDNLTVADDVIHVALEKSMGFQRLIDIVDDRCVDGVVHSACDQSGFVQQFFHIQRAAFR